jgi:transcriptional regulator with GAF, ATPase, and Fis domain/tetratricopeptide (TPR) repeat protein
VIRLTDRFRTVRNLCAHSDQKVFIADDLLLERTNVVVKVFRRGLFNSDREALYRFFSWHQGVRHPHLAGFLDAGVSQKSEVFYVREYIQSSQPLFDDTKQLIQPLLATVQFLHKNGKIHGAIKPSNLFIQHGILKITDPNLFPTSDQTVENIRYTAPETLRGECRTFASDLYSVGALLYRGLSGRDPFDDFDLNNLKEKYMWGSPKPLTDICHVSQAISELVVRLLSRDVDERTSAFEETLATFEVVPVGANRAAYVGRDSHLRTMEFRRDPASQQGLTVFLVDGEPGIGKTRLIEEVRLRAKLCSFDFEMVSCDEGMAFDVVLRAIRGILRRRLLKKGSNADAELGNFATTLSHVLANVDRTNSIHVPFERTISDLIGFLARLSRQERLVLAIENVERADEATKEFIEQICLRAAEIPASLLLTASIVNGICLSNLAIDCLGNSLVHIHLRQLASNEAQELISFFGCNADRAPQILRWSGGHPLLIEEYSKIPDTSSKLPRHINSFVARLLANLSTETLFTAKIISLFENPIAKEVIAEISNGNSDVGLHIQTLSSRGIADQQQNTVFIRYECVRRRLRSSISPNRKTSLNALAYTALNRRGLDVETVATCAFRASLFGTASELFQDLARAAYEQGEFLRASELFRQVEICTKRTGRTMANVDKFKLARCYDRIGRQTHARRIYDALLSDATAQADPVLISSICAEISGPYQTHNKWDRIRLCTYAISLLPKQSSELVDLYVRLTSALVRKGDLLGATDALTKAEHINRLCNNFKDLNAAWGLLYLNRGDFKNALRYMREVRAPTNESPKLLTNLTYCLEQLGNLKLAKETQATALRLATDTGYAAIRIASLENLGTIETKLGNFAVARRLFALALQTVDRLSARDKQFSIQAHSMLLADAAHHSVHSGEYKSASQLLKKIPPDHGYPFETHTVSINLVRCELALALGNMTQVRDLLRAIWQSPLSSLDFFRIECALIQARLSHVSTQRKIALLKEAGELSEKLGTLYQYCRVMNELSGVLIQSGQAGDAQQLIAKTVSIAQPNGYQPILARTILLRALATSNDEEKSADLFKAFYMASEIGIPSLAAEIAYWIGTFQLQAGNATVAQEYLTRSVSLVDNIATQLPVSWRRGYVATTFRERANTHLRKLLKDNSSPSISALQSANTEIGNAYKAIYRLAVSAGLAAGLESLLDLLLHAFEDFPGRPAIVMLETSKGPIWRAMRIRLTDEIAHKVTALNKKAGGKTYFGSGGTSTPPKDTVAWIPLAAGDYRGGIYVTCLLGEPPFSEKEMEFLTVVGVIANRSLDQLGSRQKEEVKTARVQEFHGIIGSSKAIREVYSHIEIAAGNTATVLIEGESGTGKELVAKAIHQTSARAKGPFVAVDCGAIPDTLIEAELFGAKKGAYTDAVADRPGLFEVADRGTIFLDEIANTTPAVQAKLLRVLQEREVRRIGESKARTVDVRLIAATNGNLDALSHEGRFRKDLLYRLKVLHIVVPPLRDRRDDISMLAHAFLDKLNAANRINKTFAPGVIGGLLTHSFPGNVRELQNAVERAFFLAKGTKINRITFETETSAALNNEVQSWFKEIAEGRKNFWSHIHDRYKQRDIPREKVIALVDLGLRSTRGSYKGMASKLNLKGAEYRRFMDFLRRNRCLLDFRPYRRAAADLS